MQKNLSAALDQYLRLTFGLRYQEGQHDCALWIAGWVDIITGTTHRHRLAATYATKFEGLREHAPSGVSAAIRETLAREGWTEIPRAEPYEIGDIVLTDLDLPGIWRGHSIVCLITGASGHAYLHIRHARTVLRPPAP